MASKIRSEQAYNDAVPMELRIHRKESAASNPVAFGSASSMSLSGLVGQFAAGGVRVDFVCPDLFHHFLEHF